MIVENQKVIMKWQSSNKRHYESFGYIFSKKGEEFEISINELSKGSKTLIKCICDCCEKVIEKQAILAFKAERHFCDSECKYEYQRKYGSFNNTREKYKCDNCNCDMKVKQYVLKELKDGKRKNIFCSNECKAKWQSKNKVGKNNPNYNQIDKICEYCSKEYSVPLNQKDRTKYCSVECRQKASRNRIKKECINCSKELFKTPTDIKKNKTGLFYCSQECLNEYTIKSHREKRQCEQCGKDYETKINSTQRFCCIECQGKWQSEYLVGENAVGYNKEIPYSERYVNCDWCNEVTLVKTPQKMKQIREKGAKHFCSVKCKTEWFTKEWSQSAEWKLESSERAVKMLEDGLFGLESECQRIINRYLDDLKIEYKNEYNCKYVSIDNYLTDYNLMIEVMGTYWHSDVREYKEINYQMQVDRIKNDKIKKTYINNNYGINILYLWEEDILNNEELCKSLIEKYIKNKGTLNNYHSHNYHLDRENCLQQNEILLIPYMEYHINDLKSVINITGSKRKSMKQPDKWIIFNCDCCGKEKEQLISHYKKAKNHFCSTECLYEFNTGKHRNKVI